MRGITTIGLDLAKSIFQVHGVDTTGVIVVRRQLRRREVLRFFESLPLCLIDMEACATAHYWGRELRAMGHKVRLMLPAYVKPYVKRNKNDAADAEAICEAVIRPSMRFVGIKTIELQSGLSVHRARDLFVRQRTMLVNSLRGLMAEFGVTEAQGRMGAGRLIKIVGDETDKRVPELARRVLGSLVAQLQGVGWEIRTLDREITTWHRQSEVSRRLATIPGIGPITATAIIASVPDPSVFASARQFSAWLGLVPRQYSTGGKPRLGGISKRSNGYLRRLLMTGATAALQHSKTIKAQPWVLGLLERRPRKLVAVALANKMARIAWVVMNGQTRYQPVPTRS